MARCPFGTHRLILTDELRCKRCGQDLNVYGAVRELPVLLYNTAHRLFHEGALEEATSRLGAALALCPDLGEAHWLLAAIALERGEVELARDRLEHAHHAGAGVDLAWIPG